MVLKASAELGFFRPGELTKYDPEAIGICLSGGGYRATLFHTGSLLRLNELGYLSRASRIASVSGGSIATGILAMNWDRIDWGSDGVASHEAMTDHLVKPVLSAVSRTIDIAVGLRRLVPGLAAGNALANKYDKYIFGGLQMSGITDKVRFIFCATNLQSGGLVRFTRDYVADWKVLTSTVRTIRLADAVASSSAFPPVLSPVRLSLRGEDVGTPGGATHDDPALRRELILVDGGVYDNLGLEPIWKRCGIIFCANAGGNLKPVTGRFLFSHMPRVVYSMLEVTVNWRERMLVDLFLNKLSDGRAERVGALWTNATPSGAYSDTSSGLADSWTGAKPSDTVLATSRDLPTRLRKFTDVEKRAAMLAGYAHADAAIRRYVDPDASPPENELVMP